MGACAVWTGGGSESLHHPFVLAKRRKLIYFRTLFYHPYDALVNDRCVTDILTPSYTVCKYLVGLNSHYNI